MRPRPETRGASAGPTVIVVALHALTFAALLLWSWRKWPDPLVDFGRELYVPWQIANGRVLYRDIASLFGPLSPYVNALWFRLFGVSLMTLAIVNTAILAALTAGIYRILRTSTDRVTAAAATLTAVLLFGFSQYLDVGNYNYITPYSHEATHGLALSVAAIVAWQASTAAGRRIFAALSGLCSGLVLLTKPEIAVALAAAMVAGVAAAWPSRRPRRAKASAFLVGVATPPAGFLLYFYLVGGMRLTDAAHAVAAGWIPAITTSIARNAFYARVTGFDHPTLHVLQMLETFAGFLGFVGVAIGLSRPTPARPVRRAVLRLAQAAYLLIVAFVVPHFELSRALPLIAALGFAAAAVAVRRARYEGGDGARGLPLLMWSAFAVAMLGKMLLNAQFYHYGFYLALPAATVTVVVLLWVVPQIVAGRMGDGVSGRARWLLAAAVAVSIAPHLALSTTWFRTKTIVVGAGRDSFLASDGPLWQGEAVRDAVGWIQGRTPASATLAVLPEGVMINYLARRITPVPFVNYMPPEVMAFGEAQMVRAFDEHPPDYVLLVDRDTSEYGYPSFGADAGFGASMLSAIRARYDPVARIGRDADRGSSGAIVVMERKR